MKIYHNTSDEIEVPKYYGLAYSVMIGKEGEQNWWEKRRSYFFIIPFNLIVRLYVKIARFIYANTNYSNTKFKSFIWRIYRNIKYGHNDYRHK